MLVSGQPNQMVFSVTDYQVLVWSITAYSLLQKTHKFVLISEMSLFQGENICELVKCPD